MHAHTHTHTYRQANDLQMRFCIELAIFPMKNFNFNGRHISFGIKENMSPTNTTAERATSGN